MPLSTPARRPSRSSPSCVAERGGAKGGRRRDMGAFDQSAKYAATAEPGFVLQRLRPLLGLTLTFWKWFITKGVPLPGGPDREADLVAIADDPTAVADDPKEPGKAWLLIHEFQA